MSVHNLSQIKAKGLTYINGLHGSFCSEQASLKMVIDQHNNNSSRRKFCRLKTNHQQVNVIYSEASLNYNVPSHVVNPLPDPFFGVVALRATSPLFRTQAWPNVT